MVWSDENLCPIGVVTWLRFAAARAYQRQRLGHSVAAADAGDGGGAHRPCLDTARGARLSRPAMATARRGVSKPRWGEAVREAGLRRRRASAQPVTRASRGEREPLRYHDGPMDSTFVLR